MTTELRLNAQVVCADGPTGHLTDVILDPISDQVTHLVVEVKGFGRPQHLVPVTLVQSTSTREVRLHCSRAELRQTEFFTETEPIPLDPSTAALMVDDTLAWSPGGVHLKLPKAWVHALPVTRRESVALPDSA